MTKYVVIDAVHKIIKMVEADDFDRGLEKAGLKSGEIDWGTLGKTHDGRTVSICLYEFGLKTREMGKEDLPFYRLGRQLYAGNALIIAADVMGEDADMKEGDMMVLNKQIGWFHDRWDAEAGIRLGIVDRPKVMVNEEVIWEWKGVLM